MKKFLGLVLTGILLFCTIFSIVGCGEETGNGMTEEERIAYENIEKYHAEIVKGYSMKQEYKIANRTRGNHYNYEEHKTDYSCPDIKDETLPESRINVITTQEQLEEAFSAFPEVDFEREMVIIGFYLNSAPLSSWKRFLSGVEIDENNQLRIGFITLEPLFNDKVTGYLPQTSWIIIRMEKLEFKTVEILHSIQYNDRKVEKVLRPEEY
ncbi:MAG: hypothetical protein E7380_03825 [Clostridiales bacterium]|nr:hypothetical protein [Clostridiales bacterium]